MLDDFSGRCGTAIVTGGSAGIGAAVCRRLAQAGSAVAFTCRSRRAEAQSLLSERLFGMTELAHPADDGTRVADRQRISELILGYCRGVDRLELDLVRAAYHPGGIDHHTGFDGPVEQYIPWLGSLLQRYEGTMHLVANHLVEFSGPRAVCETYGLAIHWGIPSGDPTLNFTSGFRYVDLLECRQGRWGIVERHALREFTHSDTQRRIPAEARAVRGSRSPDDPVFVQLARLRSPDTELREG